MAIEKGLYSAPEGMFDDMDMFDDVELGASDIEIKIGRAHV